MRGAAPPVRLRLIAVLFLVLFWAACSDQASGPAAPDGPTAPAVTQLEIERQLPSALSLQGRLTNDLLALPGVAGTAVALGEDGLPTVVALVEHGGVRVIVTGKFSALDWQAQPQGKPVCGKGKLPDCDPGDPPDDPNPDPPPTARFDRPVPIGISTGHPDITAGTIGARVTDGTDVWALSNNHVYADPLGDASEGDAVIQPGTFDGGSLPLDSIGTLDDFEGLNIFGACSTIDTNDVDSTNVMDAAIALSSEALLGNATPSAGYGTPQSTTVPVNEVLLKMKVKKFARTTGLTKGQVAAINAIVTVGYGAAGLACFTGQIIISPGTFSAGGDSGGLVVVDGKGRSRGDDRKPVGLLFAGSFTHTIISPIDPILFELGDVTIDGEN